ncbi:MAG: site-specific integrase [Parabacteroides sp.]|nr:site-specific integrase [Parabacteroides sp.]
MEKVIYNLVFNRKKMLNAEGKALIQVEAYLKGKKMYFSTRVYVKPTQWDAKKRMVKNHPNKEELNRHIADFVTYLERIELSILQNGQSFSLDVLKERGTYDSSSFLSFMKKEMRMCNLKASTLRNHLSTLLLLTEYRPGMSFSDLTFNFLCKFEKFLLDKGYHKNTIAKHMKHLKRYVNLAINKDLFALQKYPFRKYRIKHIESKRGHLTPEELGLLEKINTKTLSPTYKKALDIFLFCCYTGLRFSDATAITVENFHVIEGKLWLIYSSVKTNVEVRLPLFLLFGGKAITIYKRYQKRGNHPLFAVSASDNSNMNKRLKRICVMVGIEKEVSYHVARHTNATLLLYNGVNITTVQKLLGHKSVKTTEIYSDIMDITVIRDLKKIQ